MDRWFVWDSVWCGGCGAGGAAMDKAEMDSSLIDVIIYETVPTHLLPLFRILVVKWEKERGVFLLEETAWGEPPLDCRGSNYIPRA